VLKLHSSACRNCTLRVKSALYVYKSYSCVLKSHFAFRNYTRTCVHHSMRVNIIQKIDFYNQSVVLIRMSVIITFVSVIITLIRVIITFCVIKSHCACGNYTHLRVEIKLCVQKLYYGCETSNYACEHHTMRVKTHYARVLKISDLFLNLNSKF
jgi:hypothetical protein